MSTITSNLTGLCRVCGAGMPIDGGRCPLCGAPAANQVPRTAGFAPALPVTTPGHQHTTPQDTAPHDTAPHDTAPHDTAHRIVVPAGPGPALMPLDARQQRRMAGPSRRTAIVAGIIVAVLIAGGIAYVVLRPTPSPASAVTRYFADLARGDTAAALTLVADAATDTPAVDPTFQLLTPQALADPASRPGGLRIIGTQTSEVSDSGDTEDLVHVSYRVGGTTVASDIGVIKTRAGKVPYLLDAPFVQLTVEPSAGRQISVNGIALDADSDAEQTFYVFPGAYVATVQANALFAAGTQTAALQPGGDGVTEDVSFDSPALAQGAQAAIETQVNQAIDVCAQGTGDSFDCPFDVNPPVPYASTLVWTVTTYPTLALTVPSTPSDREQVDIATATPGTVHYVDTFVDFSGKTLKQSADEPIQPVGVAWVDESGLEIQVSQ